MAIGEVREKVINAIWQGIARSGVDLSGISEAQQTRLVESIANSTLSAVNDVLDEGVIAEAGKPATVEGETILWQGRPFLSVAERYVLTSERIKVIRGIVGRDVANFELIRIQDIDFSQGVTERIFNIGDIHVRGQDPSTPELLLRNVPKPEEVQETLRMAWLEARKRHGLQFREYM